MGIIGAIGTPRSAVVTGVIPEGSITNAQLESPPKYGIAYWDADGEEWEDRPAWLLTGQVCLWFSTGDTEAPPPPGAITGDAWRRAPGATF